MKSARFQPQLANGTKGTALGDATVADGLSNGSSPLQHPTSLRQEECGDPTVE